MKEESLDFVYIDARHDYCAMTEDLLAYWPLVAPGGILAGHDYMSSPEVGMSICGYAKTCVQQGFLICKYIIDSHVGSVNRSQA